MATRYRAAVVGMLVAAGLVLAAGREALAQAAPAGQPVVVLDSKSAWHSYTALKPPLVNMDGSVKAITSPYPWVDKETALAPEGWTLAPFPDESWLRGAAQAGPHSPYASNLYLRAKFEVTDPAAVKDLKLSVGYYGGAIVYLNGQEIARGNLPKDARDDKAVAENYPASVFVLDNGEIVVDYWGYKGPKSAVEDRTRKLTDVAIPAASLRKGVNQLAIEVIRAPYDKSVAEYWDKSKGRKEARELGEPNLPYDLNWATCEIRDVKLTAGGAAGVVSSAGRAKELQAWNSDLMVHDTYSDVGDRCEPLRPVSIKAPRNGWSSGKVVLGSPKAIEGLKVTCGDLKQGAEVIPASAMRARYAVAFDKPNLNSPLESLLEAPLDSFPAVSGGAVVPIWLTVKVPATAKAGAYTGQATIEVKGEKPLVVPVNLQVAEYAVPDTQDYKTWIELMQSPDTLSLEYDVPLWSDKHFELIAQSMRYIGEIGSRVVIVPLIAQTNSGDSESMVRWIKKDDGTYDYDLTIVDKYLDTAVKNMGKPKFVVFTAWEIYLATPAKEVTDRNPNSEASWAAARWDLRGKGPAATALDPKTGQTSLFNLPRFEDPNSLAIWKPLFDRLHKDMAKRGLEDTMLLGMASDMWPKKEELVNLDKAAGSLKWINHTHQGLMANPMVGGGKGQPGMGYAAYSAYVWPNEYPGDPRKARFYGWKRPELWVEFRRGGCFTEWLLATQMIVPELEITGKQRGLGRIGADFWPAIRGKNGQRAGWAGDRYPQSKWHSCNLVSHMLNPGPAGPVATSRYEMLREGMQNCEARIAIEKVLTDDTQKAKLGSELAAKCQQLLDDRIVDILKGFSGLQLSGRVYTTYNHYGNIFYYNAGGTAGAYWYAGSGWRDLQQKLFALAAEVQAKMGGK